MFVSVVVATVVFDNNNNNNKQAIDQAIDLVKEIGRRIAEATHEPRSTAFLRQRLSIAVQRGNAFCILGTFRGTDSVVSIGDWTE